MRPLGYVLFVIGAAMALFSFTIDTTVSSAGTYVGGEIVGGGSTYNLGLLQHQMMIFQSGLALLVAGAVLMAGGVPAISGGSSAPPGDRPHSQSNESGLPRAAVVETEEEIEARKARGRKQDMTAFAVFVGLFVVVVVLIIATR